MRKSFPKMNKRRRKTIAGIMAIVLLACVYPSFPVYADKVSELEQKLKEEKEKKKDTENRIGESQNELDSLRNTTNGLKGELSDLNDNLEEVSANLDDLEGKIAAKNEEIEKTQAELEEAKQIEADQYAAMKKRIQFMYERQDYVLMETLFSSANYAELLNRSAYIESLAAYDRQQLEAFKQTRIEFPDIRVIWRRPKTKSRHMNSSLPTRMQIFRRFRSSWKRSGVCPHWQQDRHGEIFRK